MPWALEVSTAGWPLHPLPCSQTPLGGRGVQGELTLCTPQAAWAAHKESTVGGSGSNRPPVIDDLMNFGATAWSRM